MFDDAQLLLAWERGYGKPPFLRAISLLALSLPNADIDTLMEISIGRRDAILLKLRRILFGNRLETLAGCTNCGETLELSFSTDEVLGENADSLPTDQTHLVEIENKQIGFRLPNTLDLIRLQQVAKEQRADDLLAACILRKESDNSACEQHLSDSDKEKIAQAISQADPQAEILIDLKCAACDHQFQSRFDIVSFLWTEVNAWAERLLADIHALAKAYCWTETEILRLSPWRRQVYLNMVRQ